MFEEKYNLFNILDNNNKLSFDNFMEKYKPGKISTTYDGIFEEDNNTEKSEIVNSVISEVFSNVGDDDLYIATNQFIKNEEEIDKITSSETNSSD